MTMLTNTQVNIESEHSRAKNPSKDRPAGC